MLLYLTALRVVALSMTHLFSSRHLAAASTGLIITSMALVSGYIVHPEEVGWWAQWFKYVSPQWWLQHHIGKKHALKKYDQFALNTSCFYPSCAISRNFCYKNNE